MLSYKLLDVQNVTQAQVVWEAMIGEGETAAREQMVEQLRAYCHLDTLAMVEIHRVLMERVSVQNKPVGSRLK